MCVTMRIAVGPLKVQASLLGRGQGYDAAVRCPLPLPQARQLDHLDSTLLVSEFQRLQIYFRRSISSCAISPSSNHHELTDATVGSSHISVERAESTGLTSHQPGSGRMSDPRCCPMLERPRSRNGIRLLPGLRESPQG